MSGKQLSSLANQRPSAASTTSPPPHSPPASSASLTPLTPHHSRPSVQLSDSLSPPSVAVGGGLFSIPSVTDALMTDLCTHTHTRPTVSCPWSQASAVISTTVQPAFSVCPHFHPSPRWLAGGHILKWRCSNITVRTFCCRTAGANHSVQDEDPCRTPQEVSRSALLLSDVVDRMSVRAP